MHILAEENHFGISAKSHLTVKPNSSDFIYRLVHSLTKKEMEWFFRVAALRENRTGEEGVLMYVEFFRDLLAQETYDEDVLRDKYSIKNFSELKGRLGSMIFKGISFYGTFTGPNQNAEIAEISFLIHKGFYREARTKVRRCKHRAVKEESFLTSLSLLDLENDIFLKDDQHKYADSFVDQLVQERREVLRKYFELQELIGFYNQIHSKIKQGFTPKGRFEVSYVQQINEHELIRTGIAPQSNQARLFWLRLRYIAKYLSGELENSLEILEDLVATFESNQAFLALYEKEYWLRKYQLVTILFHHKRYAEGKEHLQFFARDRKRDYLHFTYYYTASLDLELHERSFSGSATILSEIKANLPKFSTRLTTSSRYILQLFQARVEFWRGNLPKAIRHIRYIIEHPVKRRRIDIQGQARIIMLLFQYEAGDVEAMEFYERMASQYLQRRGASLPFERAMLIFFRSCIRDNQPSSQLKALRKLEAKITSIFEADSSIRAFHFFSYDEWMKRTERRLEKPNTNL